VQKIEETKKDHKQNRPKKCESVTNKKVKEEKCTKNINKKQATKLK